MKTDCTTCSNYVFDEDYEEYICECSMDEDEYYRFLTSDRYVCPYYHSNDDYRIVRKQI